MSRDTTPEQKIESVLHAAGVPNSGDFAALVMETLEECYMRKVYYGIDEKGTFLCSSNMHDVVDKASYYEEAFLLDTNQLPDNGDQGVLL